LNLDESYDIAVLEIGTNHFGEVGNLATISKPNIGVITNIGSAHLEYFKNLRGVLKEKSSLLDHLESPGIAVLNADDNLLKGKISSKNSFKAIGAGIKNRSDFFASGIKRKGEKLEFCVNQKYRFTLRTLGYYNIYNALIAVAIGRIFGMEYSVLSQRLTYFNFPQSRLNLLELNKIKFINDTYNSNPVSLREALDVLGNFRTKGRKIFVMGDMLELGKQKGLFHRKAGLEASGVCDVFITVGRLSKFAAREARLNGLDAKNIFTCESTLEAKDILFKKINLCPEDIVLIKGSRSMKMEEVLKQI
jgi:UDP-N-acetylmuramoyl-tripeptide--D-alanyl-D-alanine ligase